MRISMTIRTCGNDKTDYRSICTAQDRELTHTVCGVDFLGPFLLELYTSFQYNKYMYMYSYV